MSTEYFGFFIGPPCIGEPDYDSRLLYSKSRSSSDQIIPIKEYANKNNIKLALLRKQCRLGIYRTAHKISGRWYIRSCEKSKELRLKYG